MEEISGSPNEGNPDDSKIQTDEKFDTQQSDSQQIENQEASNSGCSVVPTPSKVRKVSSRKQQKYRKAWEFYPEFRDWLESVEGDVYKARCKVCGKVVVADSTVLQAHANAKKHINNIRYYLSAKQRIEVSTGQQSYPLSRENLKYLPSTSNKAKSAKDLIENISFNNLSISDQAESSSFNVDSNYADQGISFEMSHLQSMGRKPVEPPSFTSKAIVTKQAPPWKATAIVNGHVTRLELNDYKGRYLILFFYPQDFSAICPTEVLALSDRVLEFRSIQTEIVACSVDSHLTHLAWARTPRNEGGLGNPKIPLLADPTHSIARDYGVLLADMGHSLRAHFIIDRRGILRHMMVNDLGVGRSVDELLRTTQALQHVDETETNCPADWKPGMASV